MGEKVTGHLFIERIRRQFAKGGLGPCHPPDAHQDEGPRGHVATYAHDQSEAHQKQQYASDVAQCIPFCAQFVVFFTRGDFGEEGIVKTKAAPESDVGEKQTQHAPFQMRRIEEVHGHARQRSGVAEDLHQLQLFAGHIRHPAEEG